MIEDPDPEKKPFVNDSVIKEHFMKPKPALYRGVTTKMEAVHVAVGTDHILVAARPFGEPSCRAWSSGNGAYGKLGHGNEQHLHELKMVRIKYVFVYYCWCMVGGCVHRRDSHLLTLRLRIRYNF